MYDNESLESASTLLKKGGSVISTQRGMVWDTLQLYPNANPKEVQAVYCGYTVHADKDFFFKSERIIGNIGIN